MRVSPPGLGHPVGQPPIVLVHGLIVSSRYMVPTAERLAPFFPVYALDLPGFGRSAKPPRALDVPQLADALAGWMDAVGLEWAVLIGNSFGCQIIADFTTRYPHRVRAAVLAGPTMDPAARTTLRQAARLLIDTPRERPSLILIEMRDLWAIGPWRAWLTFRYALRDRIEEKLSHARAPALVVCGSRDPVVPRRWAEQVARLLPRGRLVILPGVPHVANYSAPTQFVRVIREFMRDV